MEAEANEWDAAIAIVDDAGLLLAFKRMDGAPAIASTAAPGKTAALTKQATQS